MFVVFVIMIVRLIVSVIVKVSVIVISGTIRNGEE